jgi:hypothetical protein
MSDLLTWNLADWTVTLGAFPISRGAGATGAGPDVFMAIKQSDPDFKITKGADGTNNVSATNQTGTDIEITVMQTNSPTNGYLSAARITAKEAGQPLILPLIAKDENGTTVFSAMKCLITGPPDQEIKADPTGRTWKLWADPEINLIGGN